MKLKKMKDQSVGVSVLLRKGNEILMGANTETKYRSEMEEKPCFCESFDAIQC